MNMFNKMKTTLTDYEAAVAERKMQKTQGIYVQKPIETQPVVTHQDSSELNRSKSSSLESSKSSRNEGNMASVETSDEGIIWVAFLLSTKLFQ